MIRNGWSFGLFRIASVYGKERGEMTVSGRKLDTREGVGGTRKKILSCDLISISSRCLGFVV